MYSYKFTSSIWNSVTRCVRFERLRGYVAIGSPSVLVVFTSSHSRRQVDVQPALPMAKVRFALTKALGFCVLRGE